MVADRDRAVPSHPQIHTCIPREKNKKTIGTSKMLHNVMVFTAEHQQRPLRPSGPPARSTETTCPGTARDPRRTRPDRPVPAPPRASTAPGTAFPAALVVVVVVSETVGTRGGRMGVGLRRGGGQGVGIDDEKDDGSVARMHRTVRAASGPRSIASAGNLRRRWSWRCRSTVEGSFVSVGVFLTSEWGNSCLGGRFFWMGRGLARLTSNHLPSRVLMGAGPGSIRPFSQGYTGLANGVELGVQCRRSVEVAW